MTPFGQQLSHCRLRERPCLHRARVQRTCFLWDSKFTKSNSFNSLPESVMDTFPVILTLESVDETLWCDHSNETSSAVLSHLARSLPGEDRVFKI